MSEVKDDEFKFLSDDEINDAIKSVIEEESKRSNPIFGSVVDDAFSQGNDILCRTKCPAGGYFDEQGVMHDSVVLKELDGRQDMELAHSKGMNVEDFRKLMVQSIVSIGDFDKKSDIAKILWGDMLIGDYMYLMMKLRQLSVGDKVMFKSECPKCGHSGIYEVRLSDLEYDLPHPPTPESRRRVDVIERLDLKFEIHWHFMTQRDSSYLNGITNEIEARRNGRSNTTSTEDIDFFTALMIPRVDKVVEPDGREVLLTRRASGDGENVLSKWESVAYLQKLSSNIRMRFKKLIDEHEPGIDTEVTYPCGKCNREFKNLIYVLDNNFFFPSEMGNE